MTVEKISKSEMLNQLRDSGFGNRGIQKDESED